MTPLIEITATDRILYFAPHPDDESLGGGGLIQHAVRAGAAVRTVFITNGDRNPWPQRIKERRWTIGAGEQQRWGSRRQAEAVRALALLGVSVEAITFYGWPDQGVAPLLLRADEAALGKVHKEIDDFRPTLIVLPSQEDIHPDHSAFYVMARLAMARLAQEGFRCPQITYVIHAPHYPVNGQKVAVALNGRELNLKRDAIQLHKTQMLSRKRFLSHATPVEKFLLPPPPQMESATHPIRFAKFEGGALKLMVELPKLRLIGDPKIHIAIESLTEGHVRWTVPLPHRSARARLHCAITGAAGRLSTVRMKGRVAEIAIPVWGVQPVGCAYVKLDCRPIFYDVAGWHEVPVVEETAPAPLLAPKLRTRASALQS